MELSNKISGVRPFVEEDIPAVASIHWNVFGAGGPLCPELKTNYHAYFNSVYLQSFHSDRPVKSLVYEEGGKVSGFLGAVGRGMSWHGMPIHVAVATNFTVSPGTRGIAGVKLMAAFLGGSQDLSIADEAGMNSRKVWQGLGGRTSLFHSTRWICLLSPARTALRTLGTKRAFSTVSHLLSPAAHAIDALVPRVAKTSFRHSESPLVEVPFNPSVILRHVDGLLKTFPLRSMYSEASLTWLLRRAESKKSMGPFQRILVTTSQGKIAGWYFYYAKPGGIGEVLQIAAADGRFEDVFDHLYTHARARGVIGLAGRPERELIHPLSRRFCVFGRYPWWVLVHSRRTEILDAFQRGDAFFSRLDGEWCCHFKD